MPGTDESTVKGSKAKRRRYLISVRELQCFNLWLKGATYREMSASLIADAEKKGEPTVGLSHEQCRRNVLKVLDAENQDIEEEIQAIKVKNFRRLEGLFLTFETASRGGIDPTTKVRVPNVRAGKLALEIVKEVNDMTGNKSPVKVANPDGTPLTQPIADAITSFEKNLQKVYDDAGGDNSESS